MSSGYSVGQKIELNDGRVGIIRFTGTTSFQTGDWIGVELPEPTGKNDGSVKGERYFTCERGYGMFLRPAGVRQVLEDVRPKPKATTNGNAAAGKSRPTVANGVKRQSVIGAAAGRGSAVGDSPTPGARNGLGGLRSPTKGMGSNGVSSASTSRTTTPPIAKKPATSVSASSKAKPGVQPSVPSTAARRQSGMPAPASATPQRKPRPSLAPLAADTRPTTTASRSYAAVGPAKTPLTTAAKKQLSPATEEATSEADSEQLEAESSKASEVSSEPGKPESNGENHNDEEEDTTIRFAPPPPVPPDPPQISPTTSRARRPSSPAAASIHSQRTIRSTAASTRQIEELEAKVRLLERKRMDDRGVKKTLEQAQQERDQYKGIIEKLQTKYRPQQQEITDLKQALTQAEKKAAEMESAYAEHDSVVEMATLDREMAEETAEGLKAELEALRAHNEEVQLELDILKEENADLTKEMSPEERESAGWVQLQHSNERLRNALLALRDRSLDEKEELKEQIQGLQEQTKDLDGLRTQHEETRERLLRSEADTDDLKQQLEVALQAEEMIEELTERNGRLEATVDDMRVAIEDLENLKELNDELELNHVEAEKQMQDEIDFKDSLLIDRERTTRLQQEALDGKDDTIRQFRTLVGNLQADMTDMKASKQISEIEAKDLEDKSRAMLDLNLKLQTSAAKTQVKAIDLELRKLEAQEASEHLNIVQMFLPDAYQAERDSVLSLLRFKRIGFKANLVHGFIKERVAAFGSQSTNDQHVFAACDVLDKLTWITAMADRFNNAVRSCSIEEFAKFESAHYELEPVERTLNGCIDAVRREEVKEAAMGEELYRSTEVMSHLSTSLIKESLAAHADDLIMRTLVLQSRLESAATALQLSRSIIASNLQNPGDEEEDDDEGAASDLAIILNRADMLTSQARSAKVMAGKMHRSLTELHDRSLTLATNHKDDFESSEAVVVEAATYTRRAGDALQKIFGEEGRNDPFTAAEIAEVLSRTAVAVFSLEQAEPGPFAAFKNCMDSLTSSVTDLTTLPNDLDNTVEFERGSMEPWVARANELKKTKLTSQDTEAELARTLEALRGRDTVIKEKETELEEQSVRIEMLEARMKDASKRSARIGELEKALHEAKDSEKKAKRDLHLAKEEQEREIAKAREEMGRLGEAQRKAATTGELDDGAMSAAAQTTLKRYEHKITHLEGAIRHLHAENHNLRLPPADSPLSQQQSLSWLHEPLVKPKSEKTKQRENLQKEGKDLLLRLMDMAVSKPQVVDLGNLPENKLAWRPAKDTGRWKIERRKEEWEGWRERRRDIVLRSGTTKGRKHTLLPEAQTVGGAEVVAR